MSHKITDRIASNSDRTGLPEMLDSEHKLTLDGVKHQKRTLRIIGDNGAPAEFYDGGLNLLTSVSQFDLDPKWSVQSSFHGLPIVSLGCGYW